MARSFVANARHRGQASYRGTTVLDRLASAGLEPVWVLAGEKTVYAGHDLGDGNGFGGCLYHTTVFTVESGNLKSVGQKTEFRTPSAEQLKVLQASALGREA